MKKILVFLVVFLLTVLEVTLFYRFSIGWHRCGLFLTSVVVAALFDHKCAHACAVVCGFLLDCIQSPFACVFLLAGVLAVAISKFLSGFMYKRSVVAAVTLSAVITFLFEFLMYCIFFLFRGDSNVSFVLTKLVFPQVFINSFVAVPVYILFRFLWKHGRLQKERW